MKDFRNIIGTASVLLLAAMAGGCTGEYAQPPVNYPVDQEAGVKLGKGEWNDPFCCYQIGLGVTIENENGDEVTEGWVTGYIVGWVDTNVGSVLKAESAAFDVPATVASNLLMADTPGETDWEKCVTVQLPSGAVRTALNLVDHPENKNTKVTIFGTVGLNYCGVKGVRAVSLYNWGDKGIWVAPSLFKATFPNGDDCGFTFDNGGFDPSIGSIWKADYRFGLVATAYINGTRYNSDAWAVSPLISIPENCDKPYLEFRWAANYFTTQENFKNMCSVWLRGEGEEWTEVTVPNLPAGNNFDYVDSGKISLSAWTGRKVQVGFHYTSTPSLTGTWEIDDVRVADESMDVPPADAVDTEN